MKLSDFAKKAGISYRTAWRWWKRGWLKASQAPSGLIIVDLDPHDPPGKALRIPKYIKERRNKDENKANYADYSNV